MKRAEIEFCEMWCECREGDEVSPARADAWGRSYVETHGRPPFAEWAGMRIGHWEWSPYAGSRPVADMFSGRLLPDVREGEGAYVLTGTGLDLVASYEAALAQGLEIVADEDRAEAEELERSVNEILDSVDSARPPCPKCKGEGSIGITIEYGAQGGIMRVWPATCPVCEGSKVAPPALESTAHEAEAPPPTETGDGWRPLTLDAVRGLIGEMVEVRYRDASLGEVEVTTYGLSGFHSSTVGVTFRFDAGYEVRRANPWITEPKAMRELLRCGETVEARWHEPGLGQRQMTLVVAQLDPDWTARLDVATGHHHWFRLRPLDQNWSFPVLTAVRRVLP